MLHAWAANIRYDRYCSNFLEVGMELNTLSFGACTSSHDVVDYYEHVSFDIIQSVTDVNTQYNINDTIS